MNGIETNTFIFSVNDINRIKVCCQTTPCPNVTLPCKIKRKQNTC